MSFLTALGWSPFFEEEWRKVEEHGTMPARVIEEQKGHYRVTVQPKSDTAGITVRLTSGR